jgi:tripartite-type tricarboxylate transporter receptor subunit TctC
MIRKRLILLSFLVIVVGVTVGAVQADSGNYPNREVEFVVPYAAATSNDFMARLFAEALKGILNVPVIVVNKGGAGGNIGTAYVANAKPDGYTIGTATTGALILNPIVEKKMPYKLSDLTLICQTATYPLGIFVREDAPWKTLKELIDYAKKNPGKVRAVTGGPTGINTFLLESIKKAVGGMDIISIPGEGGEEKVAALLGGHVDFTSDSFATQVSYLKAGKVRALAVSGSVPGFPQLPTFASSGLEGVGVHPWSGVDAPKGLPQPVVDKLAGAFEKAAKDPMVVKRLNEQVMEPEYLGPKAFEEKLRREDRVYSDLAKQVGLIK